MKILLAEDDSNIAAIAKMVLEKIGGHQVTHVANGQLAVEQSQAEKFDLILLDEMMPKLNGLGAFNKIKELDNNHPPVIFLSAKSQNDEIDKLSEVEERYKAFPDPVKC